MKTHLSALYSFRRTNPAGDTLSPELIILLRYASMQVIYHCNPKKADLLQVRSNNSFSLLYSFTSS